VQTDPDARLVSRLLLKRANSDESSGSAGEAGAHQAEESLITPVARKMAEEHMWISARSREQGRAEGSAEKMWRRSYRQKAAEKEKPAPTAYHGRRIRGVVPLRE